MASARHGSKKRSGSGRDPGGFVALPWTVLDSAAYRGLSHTARSLLMEVARQYHGDDNGRMLLSGKYLATRGWNSPEVIVRAKRELLEARLIFETVKGYRPSKASWYAVTWLNLDKLGGYDLGVERAFERGAYRSAAVPQASGASNRARKNAVLTTSDVVEMPRTATSDVVERGAATTSDVARRAVFGAPPTTSDVHPLEMPSAGVGVEAVPAGLEAMPPPARRPVLALVGGAT